MIPGGRKLVYQAEAGILVVHQKDPLDDDPPPPPGERNGQSPPQLPEAGMSYVAYFRAITRKSAAADNLSLQRRAGLLHGLAPHGRVRSEARADR